MVRVPEGEGSPCSRDEERTKRLMRLGSDHQEVKQMWKNIRKYFRVAFEITPVSPSYTTTLALITSKSSNPNHTNRKREVVNS